MQHFDYPGSGFALAAKNKGKWKHVHQGLTCIGGTSITSQSLFDLASLTKVVATLPICLILLKRRELDLKKKVKFYISSAGWFQEPSLGDVEIINLFNHTSGLPAWKPLFALSNDSSVLKANVLQTQLLIPGSRCYSDIGWILLGHIIERITKLSLETLANQLIFEPLGMQNTCFNPLEKYQKDLCVATEDCGWRKQLLQGIVHDENAYAIGGIAGHAGLFSTLEDLTLYINAWLDNLEILGLREEATMVIKSKSESKELPSYGIGWRLPPSLEFSSRGNYTGAMGHTGYTGTSVWFDYHKKKSVILLNNMVYPSRHNKDLDIQTFRKEIHEHFI